MKNKKVLVIKTVDKSKKPAETVDKYLVCCGKNF